MYAVKTQIGDLVYQSIRPCQLKLISCVKNLEITLTDKMHDLPERDRKLASRTLTDTNASALVTRTTKYEYVIPIINLILDVHACSMFIHTLCSCVHYAHAYIIHHIYAYIMFMHACQSNPAINRVLTVLYYSTPTHLISAQLSLQVLNSRILVRALKGMDAGRENRTAASQG